MTEESPAKKPAASRAWIVAAIVLVLGFDLAFLWQRHAHATESEFGAHPTEGAHYITGLAVQDYLAKNLSRGPGQSFADFSTHYPIVRASAWPPLFPAVQAAWTSAFGKSRNSVLLMMCLLAALVGLLLVFALHEEFGTAAGVVAAAIFLSLPLVREHYTMLLPAMLCTVWMFAAMLAFSRFLKTERVADSLWFGLCAALAILTDWTGLALLLFVPLALALARKWRLAARPSFWAGVVLAIAIAAPFAWRFLAKNSQIPSLDFSRAAAPFYGAQLATGLGIVLLLFAVPSLIRKLSQAGERDPRWSAALALLPAILLFLVLSPADLDSKGLLPVLPVAIMFAAAGCAAVAKRFSRSTGFILLIAGVVTIALFETVTVGWRAKKWSGFRPLVEVVLGSGTNANARVLVCSDHTGEGMFISEMAMGEAQPGRFIERADAYFANTRTGDDDDLAQLLARQSFDYIVFDESNPDLDRAPLYNAIRRVLRDNTDLFWEMSASPVIRDGITQDTMVRLYRIMGKN